MSQALAILASLTKIFTPGAPPAIDALTCQILPGRVTGLVGPDGAGKTTLMRLMAGLLKPVVGRTPRLRLRHDRRAGRAARRDRLHAAALRPL